MQPLLAEPDLHLENSTYHQQSSSSPFQPSFSSSPSPSSSVVQGYHPSRIGTPASLAQDVLSSSAAPPVDSRHTGGSLHHHSRAGGMDLSHLYSDSPLKASLLNSSTLSGSMCVSPRGQGHSDSCTAISSPASHLSRLTPSPTVRNLKAGSSPSPSVLQASSRLLSASGAQHYPQRHLQQPPMQGSGVRTHSGTY